MVVKASKVAPGITSIDTFMAGRARLTSAYLLESSAPALIETGPSNSVQSVIATLTELDVAPSELAHVVVTHIHLDHAGGIGQIAAHFPEATIWVHEVGAPHLADPSRLNASATRVYGQTTLGELFGPMSPVPPGRIRSFVDGERIALGGRHLIALHTPGHASHHLAIQDSSTGVVFTGDAVGVHLPEVPVLRPAAPPPEFDIEAAVASIERIRSHARGTLMFSHFGPVGSVDETCEQAIWRLREWGEIVRMTMERTDDIKEISEALRSATAQDYAGVSATDMERFDVLGGYDLNAAGLQRYWRKRLERSS